MCVPFCIVDVYKAAVHEGYAIAILYYCGFTTVNANPGWWLYFDAEKLKCH